MKRTGDLIHTPSAPLRTALSRPRSSMGPDYSKEAQHEALAYSKKKPRAVGLSDTMLALERRGVESHSVF